MTDFIFPDKWDSATRIVVVTSIEIAVCCLIFLIMGHIRRGKLRVVMDAERWSITAFLIGMIAFFSGRAIQIGEAGKTVSEPWFLAIGIFAGTAALLSAIVVVLNWKYYEVVPERRWESGDRERRVRERRQATR